MSRLFKRDGKWWFKDRSGIEEYGPFDHAEARRMRRQYLTYLRYQENHNRTHDHAPHARLAH